ncbi:MAG TPA: hypothetical protein VKV24_16615 [Casimicrobiaceae bacterium]|nr:hypothetical protein [Casimicrobiaceae bacterium]
MNPMNTLLLGGVALALAACNSQDSNRATSTPPGVAQPTAMVQPITGSAPPAPAERTPVAPNANDAAPGTNAALAFASDDQFAGKPLPSKGGAPDQQKQVVNAQDQADKAPDTAAADAAKKKAMSGADGKRMTGAAEDTSANHPRHGALTAQEESTQMPKAGQVNNHSDPALEKDSGRPSDGGNAGQSK